MKKSYRISRQTQTNWLVDLLVFLGAIFASLSGFYFLYFTSGGYRGGRNPLYGQTFLFTRGIWSDIHLWAGVLMISAVTIHVAIHWRWVKMTARRYFYAIKGRGGNTSRGAKINVAVNLVIAGSFILAAFSGIYFLFFTNGGYLGGTNPGWDPGILLSRTTWDLIHTWSGVALVTAAILHFSIHWRWILKVTKRIFLTPCHNKKVA